MNGRRGIPSSTVIDAAQLEQPAGSALLTLEPGEADETAALCKGFLSRYRTMGDGELIRAAAVSAQDLPRRLRQFVAEARRRTDWGYFQIQCEELVEQDSLQSTPGSNGSPEHGGTLAEVLLILIGGLLGDIFGWRTQQGGRLVHDIVPVAGAEHTQTSACSERELALHTEDAFHPYRADYVGLCCLRNREAAGTTVSDIRDISLDETLREILFEPRFRFALDASHDVDRGKDASPAKLSVAEIAHELPPASILFGGRDDPKLRLDPEYVASIPGDPEAHEALDVLCRMLGEAKKEVISCPGDYLFMDNQRIVHGRSPFHTEYDGYQRWFKRVNITRDLAKMADAGVSFARPVME